MKNAFGKKQIDRRLTLNELLMLLLMVFMMFSGVMLVPRLLKLSLWTKRRCADSTAEMMRSASICVVGRC